MGAAAISHANGNTEAAKDHMIDAAVDLVAVFVPFIPAGATKIAKVGKVANAVHGNSKAS